MSWSDFSLSELRDMARVLCLNVRIACGMQEVERTTAWKGASKTGSSKTPPFLTMAFTRDSIQQKFDN